MRPNLIKATDEISARARADRSLQSGRVVATDTTTNTAILDVGMVDFDGNPVYMHGVPFSPQSPPQPQDTVAIVRTSSSPYSCVIGSGAQIGGANSGQVVANGGVTSIAKSGSAKLKNDVTLSATGGAGLYQFLQNIQISGGLPGGGATGQVLAKATGADYDVIWESVSGAAAGGGVPSTIHVLTTRTESSLSDEFSLANLIDGMLKHTVSGGVSTPATAIPGTDYYKPGTSGALDTISGLVAGNANTLQSVSGVWALSTPSQARSRLGLAIGADVQAHDGDIDTIAGLTPTSDNFLQAKASAWASRTPTQATADLIPFVGDSGSGGVKGVVPAPGAGDAAAGKFLKADGGFAVPPGTGASGSPVILANDQTGTSYTLALSDAGKIVRCTNASAFTLTVPTNASVAFAVGTTIEIWQGGAIFPVTITAAGGVTLLSRAAIVVTNGQYAQVRLRYAGSDVWEIAFV